MEIGIAEKFVAWLPWEVQREEQLEESGVGRSWVGSCFCGRDHRPRRRGEERMVCLCISNRR